MIMIVYPLKYFQALCHDDRFHFHVSNTMKEIIKCKSLKCFAFRILDFFQGNSLNHKSIFT